MSKIFLTGHNGFIGKHLHPKLIKLGHEVETDIRYLHSKPYDLIIHLAAVTHIRCEFDHKLIESNILLTNEIFKTPTRVLYASSCSAAYLTNPYAYTKVWAEYCGMRHGNSLGMRFHNVYGNGGSRGIVWYLLQQPDGARISIRGAELIRDYIHIDDVIDEIIRQIEGKNTGVIDIGTGVGTQTIDLVNLFRKLSGKKLIVDVTYGLHWEHEPKEMISNNIVPHISLEEGLVKTISNENINSGSQL